MSWCLWLDDQADEVLEDGTVIRATPSGYFIAKSTKEAIALVEANGPPELMDLDHDLGGDDNAMKFLSWLFWQYGCPSPPDYIVHSENKIGADNIIAFMESWYASMRI